MSTYIKNGGIEQGILEAMFKHPEDFESEEIKQEAKERLEHLHSLPQNRYENDGVVVDMDRPGAYNEILNSEKKELVKFRIVV